MNCTIHTYSKQLQQNEIDVILYMFIFFSVYQGQKGGGGIFYPFLPSYFNNYFN